MGEKKPKTNLTIEQLRAFAADMRSQADAVDGFVSRAEELGLNTLVVQNHASGLQGIEKLAKFTGSIFTAVSKRSLELTISQPTVEESQAEVREVLSGVRKSRPRKSASKS